MRRESTGKAPRTTWKRWLLCLGVAAMFLPVGCGTTEPVLWSWPHHKRRLRTIVEDLHEVHMDIDRIIFDMPEYPVEVNY